MAVRLLISLTSMLVTAGPGPSVWPGAGPSSQEAISEQERQESSIAGGTLIAQGNHLRYEASDPLFLIITDQEEWQAFWETYAPDGQTTPPPMEFSTSFVLVGVAGARSTGGYEINFSRLEQSGDEIRVTTQLREPAPDDAVEMAFTEPYVILSVACRRLPEDRGHLSFVFETPEGVELGRISLRP